MTGAKTLVVGAVIVDDLAAPTMVLAARRTKPEALRGRWEFPGGKVERGETPQEALRRELVEELGVEVAMGDELAPAVSSEWPISDQLCLRLWFVEVVSGVLLPRDSHDDVIWLDRTSLRSVPWVGADFGTLDVLSSALHDG